MSKKRINGVKLTPYTPADYVGKQSSSPAAVQRDAERRLKSGKKGR